MKLVVTMRVLPKIYFSGAENRFSAHTAVREVKFPGNGIFFFFHQIFFPGTVFFSSSTFHVYVCMCDPRRNPRMPPGGNTNGLSPFGLTKHTLHTGSSLPWISRMGWWQDPEGTLISGVKNSLSKHVRQRELHSRRPTSLRSAEIAEKVPLSVCLYVNGVTTPTNTPRYQDCSTRKGL